MKNLTNQERVLAFSQATEITPEELKEVAGGMNAFPTAGRSHYSTLGGRDTHEDTSSD